MTRINTNVPSITAQKNLQRNNTSLNQALTRLSTGLRINSGKDDPAGLIASEELRSDITATNMAISNSERANMVIATADSALGQISGLLNDIRGLVTEAANEGAMSPDQIAANQLQVDASIQAINRIAATTSFQGRKLLDGSLDFIISEGNNFGNVNKLQINQANIGANANMAVTVEVTTAATQAKISEGVTGPSQATAALSLTSNVQLNVTAAASATATMQGLSIGMEDGNATENLSVWTNAAPTSTMNVEIVGFVATGTSAVEWNSGNNTLEISAGTSDGTASGTLEIADIITALKGSINIKGTGTEQFAADTLSAVGTAATTYTAWVAEVSTGPTAMAAGGIDLTAQGTGADDNNMTFVFNLNAGGGGGALISGVVQNGDQFVITIDTDHADYAASLPRGAGVIDTTTLAAAMDTALTVHGWDAAAAAGGSDMYFANNAAPATATADTAVSGDSGYTGLGNLSFSTKSTNTNYTDVKFAIDSGAAASSTSWDAFSKTFTINLIAGINGAQITTLLDNATFGPGGPLLSSQFDYNVNTNSATQDLAATALSQDTFTFTALASETGSQWNDVVIEFATGGGAGSSPTAVLSGKTITVQVASDATSVSRTDLLTAMQNSVTVSAVFSVALSTGATTDGNFVATRDAALTANTGTTGGGAIDGDVTFTMSGELGSEVFSFESGTIAQTVVDAVNLNSDATNVTARIADGSIAGETAGDIMFEAVNYGSKAFVQINVINDAGSFKGNLSSTRDVGVDVVAKINGYTATGDGNEASIRTATLDMAISLVAETTDTVTFSIDGGGSKFQIGPAVLSNQQAVIGIQNINSANLGDQETGRLYQLASGGSADLTTDTTTAYQIVDKVITDISTLRGRLGAFQSTTLESNIKTLEDTVENLVAAESQIRDADFAAESAALTRAQILTQSTIAVLGIANQQPQNVLRLIG